MKLLINENQAYSLLQKKIREGVAIEQAAWNAPSLTSLKNIDELRPSWEQEAEGLLLSMFDTSEIAREFEAAGASHFPSERFDEMIDFISKRVSAKYFHLQLVRNDLSKFEKAVSEVNDPDYFWSLIHPEIAAIAKSRFDAGHFADAVENALKGVNAKVKEEILRQTGDEYDGAPLMNFAFSVQNPRILLGDLNTSSGQNIQKGYMQIFSGAMTGIRNPKAHDVIDLEPLKAIHLLFLASLLMHKVDEGLGISYPVQP